MTQKIKAKVCEAFCADCRYKKDGCTHCARLIKFSARLDQIKEDE